MQMETLPLKPCYSLLALVRFLPPFSSHRANSSMVQLCSSEYHLWASCPLWGNQNRGQSADHSETQCSYGRLWTKASAFLPHKRSIYLLISQAHLERCAQKKQRGVHNDGLSLCCAVPSWKSQSSRCRTKLRTGRGWIQAASRLSATSPIWLGTLVPVN